MVCCAQQAISPKADPFIEKARAVALSFVEQLPHYVVSQSTKRKYLRVEPSSGGTWRTLDEVSAQLVYVNGKEIYSDVMRDGKPAPDLREKQGMWSTGEYAYRLGGLFAPAAATVFHSPRSAKVNGRPALVYSFAVEQQNSGWVIMIRGKTFQPAHKGTITFDRETARVLELEMNSRDFPRGFPIEIVTSKTKLGQVRIGDNEYFLPVEAEVSSCTAGVDPVCTRNVSEFRDYRKFTADSSIKFEP